MAPKIQVKKVLYTLVDIDKTIFKLRERYQMVAFTLLTKILLNIKERIFVVNRKVENTNTIAQTESTVCFQR